MVAAAGTRPRAKKRSPAAEVPEQEGVKPPRKARAPRRTAKPAPPPFPLSPPTLDVPAPSKGSRRMEWVQDVFDVAKFITPLIGFGAYVAYISSDITREYMKNSGQLVSEQSCRKRGLDRLERELDRIQERIKDFEDPPPKGFAGLQLPKREVR